jgi:hypothetical protein
MHSPLRLRLTALALLGLSALWLTACQPAEPRAASLEPRALLQLRFDKPDEPQDLDVITSEEDRNAADRTVVRATVKPLQVAQLDETHAVLLTDVQTGQDCHACPGLMGAYFYERDARGWRLAASQDAVVEAGVYGRLGKVAVHTLAPGQHAATIEGGSCWQGNCRGWLVVMRLHANAVQLLEENLALSMDNSGADGVCAAGAGKEAPEEADADAETQACVDVQGKWRFEGQRLLVDFQGQTRDIKDGKPQAMRPVRERAVYELQANGLKRVEGTNPVPDF